MTMIGIENFRITKAQKELIDKIKTNTESAEERSGDSKIVAVFDVNYGNCITIEGVRLMEGSKGAFISMPSVKREDEWKNIAYFKTKEIQQEIYKLAGEHYVGHVRGAVELIENQKVRVTPLTNRDDKLLGLATITVADLVINNIKIMNSDKGAFVAFPQQRKGDEWKPVVFPKDGFMRQELSKTILNAYEESLVKVSEKSVTEKNIPVKEPDRKQTR